MSTEPSQPIPSSSPTFEQQVERRPVPIWLFILVLLMIYWGMLDFDLEGGWFSQEVYTPYHSAEEVVKWQPVVEEGLIPLGRWVYFDKPTCKACHMEHGKGTPGQFPSLVGSEWVNEKEPGRLIRIVLLGLNGPLQFQGQSFNGTMVPWRESLTDEEVAAVLTFIRQNKEWGNNAPEVTPERVKAVKDKLKGRQVSFTPDELLTINPAD